MTLTPEESFKISESMWKAHGGVSLDHTYVLMLAAGMRELAGVYRVQSQVSPTEVDFVKSTNAAFLHDIADDLEGK